MQCLYCKKRLGLFASKKRPFCSTLHENWYQEEQSGSAIRRLLEPFPDDPPAEPEKPAAVPAANETVLAAPIARRLGAPAPLRELPSPLAAAGSLDFEKPAEVRGPEQVSTFQTPPLQEYLAQLPILTPPPPAAPAVAAAEVEITSPAEMLRKVDLPVLRTSPDPLTDELDAIARLQLSSPAPVALEAVGPVEEFAGTTTAGPLGTVPEQTSAEPETSSAALGTEALSAAPHAEAVPAALDTEAPSAAHDMEAPSTAPYAEAVPAALDTEAPPAALDTEAVAAGLDAEALLAPVAPDSDVAVLQALFPLDPRARALLCAFPSPAPVASPFPVRLPFRPDTKVLGGESISGNAPAVGPTLTPQRFEPSALNRKTDSPRILEPDLKALASPEFCGPAAPASYAHNEPVKAIPISGQIPLEYAARFPAAQGSQFLLEAESLEPPTSLRHPALPPVTFPDPWPSAGPLSGLRIAFESVAPRRAPVQPPVLQPEPIRIELPQTDLGSTRYLCSAPVHGLDPAKWWLTWSSLSGPVLASHDSFLADANLTGSDPVAPRMPDASGPRMESAALASLTWAALLPSLSPADPGEPVETESERRYPIASPSGETPSVMLAYALDIEAGPMPPEVPAGMAVEDSAVERLSVRMVWPNLTDGPGSVTGLVTSAYLSIRIAAAPARVIHLRTWPAETTWPAELTWPAAAMCPAEATALFTQIPTAHASAEDLRLPVTGTLPVWWSAHTPPLPTAGPREDSPVETAPPRLGWPTTARAPGRATSLASSPASSIRMAPAAARFVPVPTFPAAPTALITQIPETQGPTQNPQLFLTGTVSVAWWALRPGVSSKESLWRTSGPIPIGFRAEVSGDYAADSAPQDLVVPTTAGAPGSAAVLVPAPASSIRVGLAKARRIHLSPSPAESTTLLASMPQPSAPAEDRQLSLTGTRSTCWYPRRPAQASARPDTALRTAEPIQPGAPSEMAVDDCAIESPDLILPTMASSLSASGHAALLFSTRTSSIHITAAAARLIHLGALPAEPIAPVTRIPVAQGSAEDPGLILTGTLWFCWSARGPVLLSAPGSALRAAGPTALAVPAEAADHNPGVESAPRHMVLPTTAAAPGSARILDSSPAANLRVTPAPACAIRLGPLPSQAAAPVPWIPAPRGSAEDLRLLLVATLPAVLAPRRPAGGIALPEAAREIVPPAGLVQAHTRARVPVETAPCPWPWPARRAPAERPWHNPVPERLRPASSISSGLPLARSPQGRIALCAGSFVWNPALETPKALPSGLVQAPQNRRVTPDSELWRLLQPRANPAASEGTRR